MLSLSLYMWCSGVIITFLLKLSYILKLLCNDTLFSWVGWRVRIPDWYFWSWAWGSVCEERKDETTETGRTERENTFWDYMLCFDITLFLFAVFLPSDTLGDINYTTQSSYIEVRIDFETIGQWWIESRAGQWCERLLGWLCGT